MALPIVSAAAVQKARELVQKAAAKRPIVLVAWVFPKVDNKRAADGGTVWKKVTEGRWDVSVIDWDPSAWPDKQDAAISTTRFEELEFYFTSSPAQPSLNGKTIDYLKGEFVVL